MTNVASFCETVNKGLDSLTFEGKQSLLRFLVERIVVEEGKVRVEAVIPLDGETVDSVGLRPQSRITGTGWGAAPARTRLCCTSRRGNVSKNSALWATPAKVV